MKKHRTILALCLSLFVAFVLRAEDRFFDSDGIRIHYTIEGQGEPLILIHGFSASAERNWAPVQKALIQDHISEWLGKIIVIGFGVACSMR